MSDPTWGDPGLMFGTSQQLITGAGDYLAALQAQAGQLAAPVINPTFPTVANAPVPATSALPALQTVTWDVPAEPTAFRRKASRSTSR